MTIKHTYTFSRLFFDSIFMFAICLIFERSSWQFIVVTDKQLSQHVLHGSDSLRLDAPITFLSIWICFYIHIDDFVSEQKGGAHMLQKQFVLKEKR